MKTKYSEINTLDSLDAAIRENKRLLKKQGKAVGKSFAHVQSFYSPRTLMEEGFRRTFTSLPFYTNLLGSVAFLKRRLKKK